MELLGGSWANRLPTMLTLLDLGRDFGGPGYSRAIPSAVPVQWLSQERADLAGKVLLELHIHGWLWLTKSRSCGTEFMGGSFQGCAWGSAVLQQLQELVLWSGWKSVLPWEAQGGGQCVLPGSNLAVTPCSG